MMKKVSVTALTAGMALGAAVLMACAVERDDTDNVKVHIACYNKQDKVVEFDDDCPDVMPSASPPSGLQTRSVPKPSSPRPSRQRM